MVSINTKKLILINTTLCITIELIYRRRKSRGALHQGNEEYWFNLHDILDSHNSKWDPVKYDLQ